MRPIARSRFLSDAELEAFMRAVRERKHRNAARDHAFFALLANLGLRPSEVLALESADVHVCASPPWIRVQRARIGSSPEPVTEIVLQADVARILRRWVSARPQSKTVFGVHARQAQRLFHYYAQAAGLPSGLKVYDLRHTAGARLWRHTHDARVIQGLMGHSRIACSMRYSRPSSADVLHAQQRAGTVG